MNPEDCQSPWCTRREVDGKSICVGWHCAKCGYPCSMMGHSDPEHCRQAKQRYEERINVIRFDR